MEKDEVTWVHGMTCNFLMEFKTILNIVDIEYNFIIITESNL